jgi:hypothetical protein
VGFLVVPRVGELINKKAAAGGPDGTETERAVKIS